jgi:hypothetical protein
MIAGLAGLSLILNFSIVVLFNLWIQGNFLVCLSISLVFIFSNDFSSVTYIASSK